MNKIEELIKQYCPDGATYKKLEEVVNILDKKRKPIKKEKRTEGIYPYYGANGIQDYVEDYIFDGTYILLGEDGSVINKNGSPVLNWAIGKIWVNNHAHVLEQKKKDILLRYVFYYLQTINITPMVKGVPPKFNQENLKKLKIAIPPIEIQEKIVCILDNFTELTEKLTEELTEELIYRKVQYEYWNEKIFSNNKNLIPISELLVDNGYIRGPFGSALVKSDMVNKGVPIYEQQHAIYNHRNFRYFITQKKARNLKRFKVQTNDLIISCSGTVGKVSIIHDKDKKGIINQALLILRLNTDKILPQYMKYYLQSPKGYHSITANTNKSAQVNISKRKDIEKITIPVPSLMEQQIVINKLDKLDKLTKNISEGILSEIEARKIQYEYYKNKLLDFKELKED